MNHRERILAAIRHQPLDRVPTDMWATPEVQDGAPRTFRHHATDADEGVEASRRKLGGVGLHGGALACDDDPSSGGAVGSPGR